MMNSRATRVLALAVLSASSSMLTPAYGEIRRWDDSSVVISSTLVPGPQANLSYQNTAINNLYFADLRGSDLTRASLYSSWLDNADLTGAIMDSANASKANFTDAKLTNANLNRAMVQQANLRGANLTGAILTGTDFTGSDFTGANLTGGDLTGIMMRSYIPSGNTKITFTNANLTNANLSGLTFDGNGTFGFAGAKLNGAKLTGTKFQNSLNLTNTSLVGTNLSGISFYGLNFANANFTDANVAGADFHYTVTGYDGWNYFNKEMLYSTASYKNKDLHGINLSSNTLTGWNFAGQNLTSADLSANGLSSANFAGANLTSAKLTGNLIDANFANANFTSTILTSGSNFTRADLRGATAFVAGAAKMTNAILPDGTINGLNLSDNTTFSVRDHSVAITAGTAFVLADTSTLQLIFSDGTWGSTISVAPGVTPVLSGTLKLLIDPAADLNALCDKTFTLFNWGTLPTTQFGQIVADPLPAGYSWDTSELYTTGRVMVAVPEPTVLGLLVVPAMLALRRRREV